ncbi:MAG: VOC family protein [Planctomycetota bacterium]
MSNELTPFHLAFPVHDLGAARYFYGELLGCPEGRSSDRWIDYDFFGHQIVAHQTEDATAHTDADSGSDTSNPVDGHDVPVPHFGVVLSWDAWHALADRLRSANITFVIAPYIRFEGQIGEQATMFFKDPSGNALEFKSFRDPSQLFAK